MRKTSTKAAFTGITLLIILCFSSCFKDSCTKTYSYTINEPVYATVAQVRANIKSNTPREIEYPGKLFIRGNYIFLNEIDKGIHIINNTNPASPKQVAFIDIPGNIDLAVKGDVLYADLYTDLVAIDISNPLSIAVKKIVEGVFPHRLYSNGFSPDSNLIITKWNTRDTTIKEDCNQQMVWGRPDVLFLASGDATKNNLSTIAIGTGGSMARFAVVNNYLYTVGLNELSAFTISEATNPSLIKKNEIGWNIETIYPFKNRLFIGSRQGMFIYDISNPSSPEKLGEASHVRSCDPVIAEDNYAYVTLRSGTLCEGFSNQLDVLNITNPLSPSLIKSYPMTNPHGLSKDGSILFVCDGKDGLKIFDASGVTNINMIKQIKMSETFDVIAYNKIAIVSAEDGLYQYDYTNTNDIKLLSKMGLKR
ncbi:MAG: hypothetical protein HYX40_04990 [Sphingobacteriales bacterium]|nr:hypothetical protein [Sphingobacteriales bacterium]